MFDNQNRGPDPNSGIPPYNTPPQGPYGTPPPYGYNVPPGGPYGAPPPYGYNIPPVEPLPLGEAIRQLPAQYRRVLTKPGAATFAMEQGKAAWDIICVQMLILGVVSALVSLLLFNFTLPGTLATSNIPSQTIDAIRAFSVGIALSLIVLTPLGLFIGIGIYHLIARAFGGQGSFMTYCYSYLLFGVPLGILNSLLTLIPIAGSYLTFPVSVYQIVLQVFMTMAVHRLSGGKATFAVLTPLIVAFVLACVLIGIIIAVIAASIHPH
ncbi:MAG: YIP1 family protein [Ktedonobacteraceae bacterium]